MEESECWEDIMADWFPNEDIDTQEGIDDIGETLMGMYTDD